MAHQRITAGIDIGSDQIKMVVIDDAPRERGALPPIIATGVAKSEGVRHGYIVNRAEAAKSITEARRQAEAMLRMPIRKAFLAVGGVSLDEARASGETIISRADQEITELDLEKTIAAARDIARPHFTNRRVLHEIPLEFRIDGVKVFGNPLGMQGTRLEADYLFITTLSQHVDMLIQAMEDADMEVVDQMASPLAGSYVLLSRDQKMKGCALLNIGADTTSLVIYDEGIPVSAKMFPEGSAQVTDDLALGFKIGLEDAERLKTGKLVGTIYPRKKVDDIITKRFERLCGLLDKHFKTTGRKGLLPAGIILSGGGAGYAPLVDSAKKNLNLPARTTDVRFSENQHVKTPSGVWAIAYGIALWGLTGDADAGTKPLFADLGRSFSKFFRQFLP